MARKRVTPDATNPASKEVVSESSKPLVFISHDTRDADIAEAFCNLLTDASGGILQSFRSSDRKGVSGIEFGAEWYRTIMERIEGATDVVALLTTFSINRPWILYEAGVAKGKLNRVVFGLAIGIPLTETNVGPFAQFQNSGDDEDSLTKLVLQLIRRNPDAAPREEAVRRQVVAFREIVSELLAERQEVTITGHAELKDTEDITKLFEEVKVMFRELPERLEGTFPTNPSKDRGSSRSGRALNLAEVFVSAVPLLAPRERALALLIAAAPVREDAPWLYDILLKVHEAVIQHNHDTIGTVALHLRILANNPELDFALFEFFQETGRGAVYSFYQQVVKFVEQLAKEMVPRRTK